MKTLIVSRVALILCAAGPALGCAAPKANTNTTMAAIPAVDPSPEFEHDRGSENTDATPDVITAVARVNPEFAAAMRDSGVAERVSDGTLHTVFVPSQDAFDATLIEGDRAERGRLVSYYVVAGRMTSSELTNLADVPTITGQTLDIRVDEASTFFAVNQARVLRPNVQAADGIVHVIDHMLLPSEHPDALVLRRKAPTSYVLFDMKITTACGIRQPRAFFKYDSASLADSTDTPFEELAMCMTSGALTGQRLLLVGHTDPRGDGKYNKALGLERAEAVKGALEQHGVLGRQMRVRSRGEAQAHDDQPRFWDFDRRVDVTLQDPASR